ncbi:hypothetical protein DFH09DRAFT_1141010, partial [Mycena vulgaris]
MSSCKRFATYSRFEGPINPFRHIALTWALICKPLFPCRGQTYNCASQNIHFPSLYCSFVDATMRSTPRPQAIALSSNKSGGRTSKDLSKLKIHQSALQVNLGSPFRILLDVDSDVETPSPLTIFFDFPKTSPLKTHATTVWADSDSDSDSDSESNASDGVQFISILSDNPFYFPPTPPTFQTTFGLPEWVDSGSDFDSYPDSDDSQYISIPSGSRFHSPTTPASFQTSFDLSCASPVPSSMPGSRGPRGLRDMRRRAVPRRAPARHSAGSEARAFSGGRGVPVQNGRGVVLGAHGRVHGRVLGWATPCHAVPAFDSQWTPVPGWNQRAGSCRHSCALSDILPRLVPRSATTQHCILAPQPLCSLFETHAPAAGCI